MPKLEFKWRQNEVNKNRTISQVTDETAKNTNDVL